MPRLPRVPVSVLENGPAVLTQEASHYLIRVHRAGVGQAFVAFDPTEQREARGIVVEADARAVRCRFENVQRSTKLPAFELTLIQALGKADKVERVVRDATALGVTRIVLAESGRSVARITHGRERHERLSAIAIDAARQSERGDVPRLEGPARLEAILPRFLEVSAAKLYFDPSARVPLKDRLGAGAESGAVVLLIGPEGGLTPAERLAAEAAGFLGASLGPFVLRTETAAVAAVAAVVALRARSV